MRTYSKKQDFWNRAKLSVIVLVLIYIAYTFMSCSDDPKPDYSGFKGNWSYESDQLNLESNFTFQDVDVISNITVNGSDGFEFEFFDVSEERIGSIVLTKLSVTEAVAFYGCVAKDSKTILADSIAYRKGTGLSIVYNQSIKKN